MIRVVIIGSGNVAEGFALASAEADGVELLGVWARNTQRGSELAARCGVEYLSGEVMPAADLFIIAVSDSAIAPLSAQLTFPAGSVVVHTAGSVGAEELSQQIEHRGVIYPLQTFTRGRRIDFGRIPLFVEGLTDHARGVAWEMATRLSNNTRWADRVTRGRLHLSGVFVCNFVNRMYGIGADLLQSCGVEHSVLAPLIEECAAKAMEAHHPAEVQTGPAVRGDRQVQERHRELLRALGAEREEEIYRLISEDIWETSKKM